MQQPNKIFHIGDVHCFFSKKFEAHEYVFNELYRNIEIEKPDLIAVLGDLIDSKSKLSPEQFNLARNLLHNLANYAPVIIILGNHDCFTPGHEILTKRGWKKIEDYISENSTDEIATFNNSSKQIEFEIPYDRIKKYYNDEVYNIENKNVSLITTKNHQILTKNGKFNANSLPKSFAIPLMNSKLVFTDDFWAQYLGFCLADGTYKNIKRVGFHFKKQRKIDYLNKLLSELKLDGHFKDLKDGSFSFNVYGRSNEVRNFFNSEKELSWNLLNKDKNFLYNFLIGYLTGDGCNTNKKNFYIFNSIHKKNIEILCTIARIVGLQSTYTGEAGYGSYENSKMQYSGSISLINCHSHFNKTKKDIEVINYEGFVYCLSVSNQNLLIRHNNKISITGNCNLQNKDRLDSISPIVYSLNNETTFPIHFFKHSGVYDLYNIDWAVWSCLDNQQAPEIKKDSSNYTIGMFHGAVKGCMSDNGFILTEGIDIEEFKDCNIVMLADIHKVQGFRPETFEKEIDEEDLQKYLDDGWEIA